MKAITNTELQHIKETLEQCRDEFEAAEDDGFVVTSGADEGITESLAIIIAIQEYIPDEEIEE